MSQIYFFSNIIKAPMDIRQDKPRHSIQFGLSYILYIRTQAQNRPIAK